MTEKTIGLDIMEVKAIELELMIEKIHPNR